MLKPTKNNRNAACLLSLALVTGRLFAQEQTSCASVGDTLICQGPGGWSTMTIVGDTIVVSRSDGSSATLQRVGDITLIIDSREGMNGIAHHVGDSTVISLFNSAIVCTKVGASTVCS